MLREKTQTIATLVFACDIALISAAFFGAHWLRNEPLLSLGLFTGTTYPLRLYLPLLPLALFIWAVFLLGSRLYRSHRTIPLGQEIWDLLKINLAAGAAFTLALYLFRLDQHLLATNYLSRAWILLFVGLSFLLLIAEKALIRSLARYLRSRGLNYRGVLIIGAPAIAAKVLDSFERHKYWGYKVVGIALREEAHEGARSLGYPLFDARDLVSLCEDHAVDEIIVTETPSRQENLEHELLRLNERGVIIRFVVNPLPAGIGRLTVANLDGVPLLNLSRTPSNPWGLLLKRALDVFVSLTTLVILSPLLLIIAAIIKLTSPGPALFRQTRVGLNGRSFKILKFRSMYVGAEDQREELEHLNEVGGPVFKVKNDPRLIRGGSFLRRFSLDELPQLWNVLVGDMSLVGPRPPTPDEVVKYEAWQLRRLSMRPGITCLWQVSGRSTVDFNQWMKLDLTYIDNWSPWLDLKILIRTLPAVLSGRGAY